MAARAGRLLVECRRSSGGAGALLICAMGVTVLWPPAARAQQNLTGLARPRTAELHDLFVPLPVGTVRLTTGMLGRRIVASERNRLLDVDENDLLDAFERRDVPHQSWQGEHVGKFLHAAALAWRESGDPMLKAKLDRVVGRLLRTQEPDGYLGTYPPSQRWTAWDVWVQTYDLIGLLTYYQFTHSRHARDACCRVGDLLIRTFAPGRRNLNLAGEHQGLAPDSVLEPMVLLYRATRLPRYLAFAHQIVAGYDGPGGPRLISTLVATHSVRRVADAKAYEMLANLNGLLDLARVDGNRRYIDDARIAWEDIVRNRLYVTGSTSAGEAFQETGVMPDGEDASICETCVTVSWEQFNLHMLELTGEARFADQLERSIYNHLLAAQNPAGNAWCYYTPLIGHKPYTRQTCCCLSSGPRGIALIPCFAYVQSGDGGLVVNLYEPGVATARLPSGTVTITQTTGFPADGHVTVRIDPARSSAAFPLRLRIPEWAAGAGVAVNGSIVAPGPLAGEYVTLDRRWRRGDTVTLDLPMKARLIRGRFADAGKVAVAWGPLVLALDASLNASVADLGDAALTPDAAGDTALDAARSTADRLVFRAPGVVRGRPASLYLTPFATAGEDGVSRFEVWLPVAGTGRKPGAR